MRGFFRYCAYRILFAGAFGRGYGQAHPSTHNVIAVPRLVNVQSGPTPVHSRYWAGCRLNLHGVETDVRVEADTQQHALDKLSRALNLEPTG